MQPDEYPSIMKTIRMYRSERGWTYEKARDAAIDEYRKRGWYIPASIEGLYLRPPLS